jgi:hypothetical protein
MRARKRCRRLGPPPLRTVETPEGRNQDPRVWVRRSPSPPVGSAAPGWDRYSKGGGGNRIPYLQRSRPAAAAAERFRPRGNVKLLR